MSRKQLIPIFLLLTALTACDRDSSASSPEKSQVAKNAMGSKTTKEIKISVALETGTEEVNGFIEGQKRIERDVKLPQMVKIMQEHRPEIEARLSEEINRTEEELKAKLEQRCKKENVKQKTLREHLKKFYFRVANNSSWLRTYKESTKEEYKALINLLIEYGIRRYNLTLIKKDIDFSLIENKESSAGDCSLCLEETTVFNYCVANNKKCVANICIKCYCESQWVGTGVALAYNGFGLCTVGTPNYRCPYCKSNPSFYFRHHIAREYSDSDLEEIFREYRLPNE